MLRLEKMEICGFKSFGDRTEVRFPLGVTAVVGPNGCGKSNIGDALNWVLGEQSAKTLRGQQMSDVIFSGSAERKPLGMAEVSLCFSGGEGSPYDEQGNVVVTRRLFRSGESEYELNGSRARLKDIQEMLRRARIGARTYATIEQGRIDQVLNAKPRERRALIEDAAGVSGYKHKRRLAELKLEGTSANLLRVNDIVVEVQRQINSLKRQAAKARRYRRLREELRSKEFVRFAGQARELDVELERLRSAESTAGDAQSEASVRLGQLEVDLQQRREALEQLNRRCRESAERSHQLDIEIDREESQIRSSRERIAESTALAARLLAEIETVSVKHDEWSDRARQHNATLGKAAAELEAVATTLRSERDALQDAEREQQDLREALELLRKQQYDAMAKSAELANQLRSLEEATTRADSQRERIETEQAETGRAWTENRNEADQLAEQAAAHEQSVQRHRAELADNERRLDEARRFTEATVETLADAREQEKSGLARLATLEDVETRFAGVSDGVKRLLSMGRQAGIRTHGVVADYVEAHQEIEGAAEVYLQALLPAVIVEDDEDVRLAAEFLNANGAGRTSLICRTQPVGAAAVGGSANGKGGLPRELLEDQRVVGSLRERLTLKSSGNGAVAERIGEAVLVDSLASALVLHRRYPASDFLTPDGEVVYASGVISAGGRSSGGMGLLEHKRRMETARHETVGASHRVAERREKVEEAHLEVARLENGSRVSREKLEQTTRSGVELEVKVQRSRDESERSGRQSAVLADELEVLRAAAGPLEENRRQVAEAVHAAESNQQELGRSLTDRAARLDSIDASLRERLARVTELRATEAAKGQRMETLEQEEHRLTETAGELKTRLDALSEESVAAKARAQAAQELLTSTEEDLGKHLEQREQQTKSTAELERESSERRDTLTRDEAGQGSVRAELESLREKTREAELDRARSEAARSHLDDLCKRELGISAGEATQQAEESEEPPDLERLEADIVEIKEKIERIGPVNMTAIEEFTELEERHGFLSSQQQDLDRSMERLKETIRRINRESRQRFLEAFEKIRVNYQDIFKLLFTGGRADLRLEEGEDVLECGIEILAQPPGKRLSGVHLLSGGEKALSAIALLFAIFRYQPSPFCLLDEVDAALDDANVVRFTKMIEEFSKNTQFVVVTHNKLSMESANRIYGVTMEERGVSKIMSLELT